MQLKALAAFLVLALTPAALITTGTGGVAASPLPQGQGKPNFSGVWTGRRETPMQMSTGALMPAQVWALTQPVTITQDDTRITIAYVSTGRSHNPVVLTYRLDGTETRNDVYGPGVRGVSKAVWEGTSLVLITLLESADAAGVASREEIRDRLILESATTFRLETSRSVRNAATSVARFQRQVSRTLN